MEMCGEQPYEAITYKVMGIPLKVPFHELLVGDAKGNDDLELALTLRYLQLSVHGC